MIIEQPLVYFKNYNTYESVWNGTNPNVGFDDDDKDKKIIFVEDQGKIYTHGHAFGGGPSNVENIEQITINEYGIISPNNLPTATYTSKGIVQVEQNGGITVNNGVISADIPEIINGINGQAGKDGVPGLNATSFTLTPATSTNLGGVKIGSHVNVTTDGTISVDPSEIWTTIKQTYGSGENGLDGLKGDPGEQGPKGDKGDPGESGTANISITATLSAGEDTEKIASVVVGSNTTDIYAHKGPNSGGGGNTPSQYLKNATYSNNVLTITPNSGSSISVTIPTSGNGNTGGSTYYGGTGISIDDQNLISVKQATNTERGGVKIWTKDNNVTIDGITLGDSNNRRYAVNLDSNGVAYVQVPWSDTTFDPVNNEYIQTKLDQAEQRQNELSGQMEDIADNLATIVDEEFQQKLTQAREAIENAQDDLDRLQELLQSDVVLRTDPTQVKLAEFLDRGNNSYYTFDEAIDLTLLEKLSDENPEAAVYSKVLKIVKDNSIDGETVNGRISSAVTNVKDEITVDLDGYAKKQFVADTVSTQVNTAKQEVYDTYTQGGLTIGSDGKVKIDASKAKFTNGDIQEQSLSEIINDATNGIIATAATKDWVNEKLANSGLILGTDGKFSLLSQLRKLANGDEEEVGELESLAGIIGETNSVGGKISALAESAITGAKASIIAEARGDQSWIELTADQITLAGETIADKINALEITTGNFNTTNANIQNRLSAAEAKIGNLEVGTINAQQLKTGIADAGYLVIDDNNSSTLTAFTPDGLYFAQNKQEIYENIKDGNTWAAWNTSLDNLFGKTSQITNNGLYFYPNGTSGNNAYGIDMRSTNGDTEGGSVATWLHLTDSYGTAYIHPTGVVFSDTKLTGRESLYYWPTGLTSGDASYVQITPGDITTRRHENTGDVVTTVGGSLNELSVRKYNSSGSNFEYQSTVKPGEISVTHNNGSVSLKSLGYSSGPYLDIRDDRNPNKSLITHIGTDWSSIPGTLYVGDYVIAQKFISTASDSSVSEEDKQAIVNSINALIEEYSGDASASRVTTNDIILSGYYDNEGIKIFEPGVDGIQIGKVQFVSGDEDSGIGYISNDSSYLNISSNVVRFGDLGFGDSRNDEMVHLANSGITLHSEYLASEAAGDSQQPSNRFLINIENDGETRIEGTDITINSYKYDVTKPEPLRYSTGDVTIASNLVVRGDITASGDTVLHNSFTAIGGSSDSHRLTFIHPDGDSDPTIRFRLSDQSQLPSIDIKAEGDYEHVFFYTNYDFYFHKNSGGPAPIHASSFVQGSDRNLKNVGTDITLTAEQVADAPAVNFTWKSDENGTNHVGSIAQYWQVVMPEVVSQDKSGTLGLDYATTALMSAITVAKEVVALKEEIAQLKAQINELTSNN